MRASLLPTLLMQGLLIGACSQPGRQGGNPGQNPPPGSGTDDGGSGPGPVGGIDPGGGDCSDAAKLVYVVDENNMLSNFDPATLQFKDIGTLNCPAQAFATPFSMAIDRSPSAWVLYSSGEIFHVDVSDAKCSPTSFQPGQMGFLQFGMGFATNSPTTTDETLFIAGSSDLMGQNMLGSIAFPSLMVTSIGDIAGTPELTGTGDANLWGFFPDAAMPKVAQIDKTSGALANPFALPSLAGTPAAWAFAFWGGDFWIFLMRQNDPSTTVYHLYQSNGKVEAAVPKSGRKIVGAGVSTCAPLTIG